MDTQGAMVTWKMEDIHREYLMWFRQHALDDAEPCDTEGLIQNIVLFESILDDDFLCLTRIYYMVTLPPQQSRSSRLELFIFSELNLSHRVWYENGSDDILSIQPLEYRLEMAR